jgi:hypothetical protein
MTPMAAVVAPRLARRRTPRALVLLDRPVYRFGALARRIDELFENKAKKASDRAAFLGPLARGLSAAMRSGLIEDSLMLDAGAIVVTLATPSRDD